MTTNPSKADFLQALGDHYDRLTYSPLFSEYFGWGEFMNFGYWDDDTASIHDAAVNLGNRLIGMLPHRTGTILDVACGKGANSKLLLAHYEPEQITGVNISDKQLATCRENIPGATFVKMDAANLEFDDATFDNILCVEAAFHFDTRQQFLESAHRVLKPGGSLVLSDILMAKTAERERPFRVEANHVEGLEAYGALIREAGFADVDVSDATKPCWHAFYWYVVRFLHEKYLRHELPLTKLKTYLNRTYQRVPDLDYYVLARAIKRSER